MEKFLPKVIYSCYLCNHKYHKKIQMINILLVAVVIGVLYYLYQKLKSSRGTPPIWAEGELFNSCFTALQSIGCPVEKDKDERLIFTYQGGSFYIQCASQFIYFTLPAIYEAEATEMEAVNKVINRLNYEYVQLRYVMLPANEGHQLVHIIMNVQFSKDLADSLESFLKENLQTIFSARERFYGYLVKPEKEDAKDFVSDRKNMN